MPEHDQPEFSDSAADALFGAAPAAVPEGALTLEEVGASFPQHEIVRVLGRGGMGMVYLARHRRHDRLEALKILPPRYGDDPEFAARFEREARALARLNHPNIVAVYDAGQTAEGRLYFTMEYVDGQNLAELIRAGAPLDAVALGEQMCAALAYAHGEGIVHRDIKPANVLVDALGRVKIADFGLARMVGADLGATELTSTGVVMGTMGYMAPEQMRGEEVDHRADLFALGAIFYEMLCRDRPVGVFDPPSTRIGCDARWDAIVSRAMQPDLARRFASATEIRTALTALKATPAAERFAHPASPGRPFPLVVRLLIMVTVLAALSAGGWWAWKQRAEQTPVTTSPKPEKWVDATPVVRAIAERNGTGQFDGTWLNVSKDASLFFADARRFRDVAVRVVYSGRVGVILRHQAGLSSPDYYLGVVESDLQASIWPRKTGNSSPSGASPPKLDLSGSYDIAAEHEMTFSVRGDHLVLWLDGKRLLEHRDNGLAEGGIALSCYNFKGRPGAQPRIKKVEYRVLDE